MRELDIVFTKSKKRFPIASWIIMLWTGKNYSHVARGSSIKEFGTWYFQSSEGKVNYENEVFFLKKHEIVCRYKLQVPSELDIQMKKECFKEAGNSYGVLQNLGIAITDIYRRVMNKEALNPWVRGRICSEILYITCFKTLIPTLQYDENKIKPGHIEDIILTYFSQDSNGYWKLK